MLMLIFNGVQRYGENRGECGCLVRLTSTWYQKQGKLVPVRRHYCYTPFFLQGTNTMTASLIQCYSAHPSVTILVDSSSGHVLSILAQSSCLGLGKDSLFYIAASKIRCRILQPKQQLTCSQCDCWATWMIWSVLKEPVGLYEWRRES